MKSIVKMIGLVLFSLFFIVAGVVHFTQVEGFASMIPDIIPFRNMIVYATGIIEWVLAILLLIPSTRRQAGIWTAIYLVLIFPANIYAAIAGIPAPGSDEVNKTLLWVRLLFQPLLIWWVLAVSKPNQQRTNN